MQLAINNLLSKAEAWIRHVERSRDIREVTCRLRHGIPRLRSE
jgi:hypothetical protein